jgi:eukaryotic-like serine/threonine-protein kinase
MEAVGSSRGSSLVDRYTLDRRLGSGGMASVWLADDRLLARRVAVKLIADTLAADEHYRARFAREAQAAASVSHPNIVPVYDYGVHDERPFLVMEYVPGGSLADVLAGTRPGPPRATDLAAELLGALACVHAAGLVHRDVKPANILLDAGGRARLTDFGIAQPTDAASLTQTGMVIGSARYLAPEVAAGARATASADLYALGVVLRELDATAPAHALSTLIAALTAERPTDRPVSADAAALLPTGQADLTVAATTPTLVAARRSVPQRDGAPWSIATRVAARLPRPAVPRVHVPPRALAVGAVVLLVGVVVLLAAHGGSPPAARATAARLAAQPAAAGAPLSDQLDALRRIVAGATTP